MFQSIQPDEIFDLGKAQASEEHPSYWLAQLRKTRKQIMAEVALRYFEFVSCDGRGAVWKLWTEMRNDHRVLVIQFRHSESDWSHGLPEFVHLEKNEPLGFVNIAGRLFCKVK